LSGSGRGSNRNPRSPGCLPGLRPVFFRSDLGGGLTNASEDGGFDEFCEFLPSRASNSATRAVNAAITTSRSANRTSNCSTEGTSAPCDDGSDT
jgi:hypothetical protein